MINNLDEILGGKGLKPIFLRANFLSKFDLLVFISALKSSLMDLKGAELNRCATQKFNTRHGTNSLQNTQGEPTSTQSTFLLRHCPKCHW